MTKREPRFVTRTQIRREVGGGVHEFAEINDLFDVLVFGGLGKVARGLQVAFGAVSAALLAVHQIISDRDAFHRIDEVGGIQRIALNDFHPLEPTAPLQTGRVAYETAHAVAGVKQFGHKPPADIPGRAGDEDEF